MSRICSKCGRPPADEALVICDKCKVAFIEEEQSRNVILSEVERIITDKMPAIEKAAATKIVKSWKFWLRLLIALLTFLAGGGGIIVWRGLPYIAKRAAQGAASEIRTNVQNQLSIVNREITNRIIKEFEEPHIKNTVTEVAATYSTNLIRLQIEPEVRKFNAELSSKLAAYAQAFDNFKRGSETNLADLNASRKITMLINAAKNDDPNAFFELAKIKDDRNDPHRMLAFRAIAQIIGELQLERATRTTVQLNPWAGTTNSSQTATFEEFVKCYQSSLPINQVYLVYQMFGQTRFPLNKRSQFLVDVLKNSDSLRCVEEARFLLEDRAKLNKNVLGVPSYIEWWEKRKDTSPETTH